MSDFFIEMDRYNDTSYDRIKLVEEEIWDKYGTEKVVLVLDMSGFSLLVQKHGLMHYLGMVRRMQVATQPIVEKYEGQLVKFETDNMYAMFDSAKKAVGAAVSINIALQAMNTMTEDNKDLFVSIGISKGRVLLVEGRDLFGDAVNIASKLGEDVAEREEILLTGQVAQELGEEFELESMNIVLSGLNFTAWKLKY